ncbi:MAG: hypothetical protein D4R93_05380 [Deltaproteobacteria bacterium]|nr:MAG: hypothetical protein D4R93_05380 [Deltaproteobacteria bacterium]
MKKVSKVVLLLAAFMLASSPAFAVDITTNGDLQQWFGYSDNAKFSDQAGLASKSGDFSFYSNPSALTGLGYSSSNYKAIKGKTDKSDTDAEASVWTRYRQWFTATSDDQNVKGVFAVEIGGVKWGYQGDSLGKSKGFGYSGDGVNVETRWLYTDFIVPGIRGHARAGLQTVPLAKDFGQFIWSETAAGLTYFKAMAPVDIGVGWIRGNSATSKNVGFSGGNFNDDAGYLNFGYGQGNNRVAFVLAALRQSGKITDSGAYSFDNNVQYGGVTGKFAAGALSGALTAIYQGGSVDLRTPTPQELKRQATLANATVSWKPSANHTITLAYLFASGDENAADDKIGNYTAVDVDMNHGLVVFEGIATEGYTTDSPYWLDKGLKMPSVRYDYSPSKSLVLSGVYSYITTDKNTQRIGAAAINSALGANGKTYGTEIGNELDLLVKYNIWKGFDALFGLGYLWAGDALDAYTNDGAEKAKNIFKSQLELRYRF